jgi:hypothetical protein
MMKDVLGPKKIDYPKNFHFWEEKFYTQWSSLMMQICQILLPKVCTQSKNGNRGRRNVSACTK